MRVCLNQIKGKNKGRGERPNCINKPNYLQSYRECLVLVFAKIRYKVTFVNNVVWYNSKKDNF